MTDTPQPAPAKEHHWKETKESVIHKGDKCKIVYHNSYGSYGMEGGFGDMYIEVSDDTSEKAYETIKKLLVNIGPAEDEQREKPKLNKRASNAVDIT